MFVACKEVSRSVISALELYSGKESVEFHTGCPNRLESTAGAANTDMSGKCLTDRQRAISNAKLSSY